MSGLELFSRHLLNFKRLYEVLCVINYFPNSSYFEMHETSRDSRYTIVIIMMSYIS